MTPRGSYRIGPGEASQPDPPSRARVSDRMRELGAGSNPVTAVIGFCGGRARPGTRAGQGSTRPAARQRRRREGAQERQGHLRLRGARDRDLRRDRATRARRRRRDHRQAGGGNPRRGARDARARRDRDPEAHRPDGRRRGLRRPLVRVDQDGRRRRPPRPRSDRRDAARSAEAAGKRTARQARKVPGVAQAEGQIKGAVASEDDLAIAGYDDLTAEEILGRLPSLSQVDLAKIDSYERRNQNRSTVLGRLSTLRGAEPWAGLRRAHGRATCRLSWPTPTTILSRRSAATSVP